MSADAQTKLRAAMNARRRVLRALRKCIWAQGRQLDVQVWDKHIVEGFPYRPRIRIDLTLNREEFTRDLLFQVLKEVENDVRGLGVKTLRATPNHHSRLAIVSFNADELAPRKRYVDPLRPNRVLDL
jgi:hypothetical protein